MFIALVALLLGACVEDDPAPVPATPTATPTATATASPSPTAAPTEATPSTPTGIVEVDAVIAAVEARDARALAALLTWQETACVTPRGMGAGGPPECEQGETNGTAARVLPVAGCEGYFVRDAGSTLTDFLADAGALHSVVEAPNYDRPEPYWPVGDVYINFRAVMGGEPVGTRLVLEEGRVVLVFFGCNHRPEDLMRDGGQPLPVIYQPGVG
ncbi:MAG: hypothetical protein DWG83_00660 [Chloroflexi bacterium]|nr:hypothetical protein [Chloroflexota bacterium]